MTSSGKPAGASGTQAIARAAALLREIASGGGAERNLADLARGLVLERPTAHRILRRLVDEGLVQQNPATRGYSLGALVYELGLVAKPPLALHSLAGEALAVVARESGDTAFAIVGSGLDSVCLDRKEGSYPVKALMMEVGRRRPMGVGAGSLAMLASMSQDAALKMLEANAARIRLIGESGASSLKEVVLKGAQDGFVLRTPVDAPEILSLGVAVCNAYGTPILGFSISALRFRIEQRFNDLVALLHGQKAQIETRLRAQGVLAPPR